MALLSTSFDYSARDQESLRLRLQGLIRSVFPDWTDFNVANFGNVLIELFAHVGDTLHYYQDAQARETFWPFLTQRISAIRIAQLIGFKLRGASAATGSITVSLPYAAPKIAQVLEGMRLRTSDPENPVPFRTSAYAEIPIGQRSVSVPVEQAELRTETFTSTDEPNQEIVLSNTPFLDSSLDAPGNVSSDDGWYTKVDSFLGYSSIDRVYTVAVDHVDRAYIQFGNGVTGAIPHGTITVMYKIGGGIRGNIEVDRLTLLEGDVFYTDSSPAPVTITNPAPTTGGADRMSLEEARTLAPASLRVLTRTVTREDFETVAEGVRGVARALMATMNEYEGITPNTGQLYVVAQGQKLASGNILPAPPSQAMLDAIKTEIDTNKPPTITFSYTLYPAQFKRISISTRIYLKQGASNTVVGAAIRAALNDFFAVQLVDGRKNSLIDFGANLKDATGAINGELAWSDIFNAIRDIDGIRKVDEGMQGLLFNTGLGWFRQSIVLLPIEFPYLYEVSITNADTGESM